MADNNNMKLYASWAEVPNEALKQIQAGRLKGMSDINPMWRIQKLTEAFGPCGVGWWYDVTREEILDDPLTKQKAVFLDILLYYVDPESGATSHGIFGTGGASLVAQERNGPYLSDEAYKMALTDAISVACKALGMASKVYYNRDTTKYDQFEGVNNGAPTKPTEPDKASELRGQAAKHTAEHSDTITELPENPDEVSQELLIALGSRIRDAHGDDKKWRAEHFIPTYKAINNNNAKYSEIADPEIRKAVYNALYEKFKEDVKHD